MAIAKEIETGMVLGKFIDERGLVYYKRDPKTRKLVTDENGEYIQITESHYYLVYLHSRRERTTGIYIPAKLSPYLRKLNIKFTSKSNHHTYGPVDYAVGCRLRRVTKDEYDRTSIHRSAKAYYDKVKNGEVQIKLTTEEQSPYFEPIRSKTLALCGVKEDENLSSYYS
ncbi:hypothetical protein_gp281 [Bacillus phage vB_BceM_WH1]|nr:hypothetical protein_gp281 [Bacillus phage vB_BceM_WH1]